MVQRDSPQTATWIREENAVSHVLAGAHMRAVEALAGLAVIAAFDLAADGAQAQSFEGAYAGIHAGYRFTHTDAAIPAHSASAGGNTFNEPDSNETFVSQSPLLGGHVGYNAVAGAFMLGFEGDFTAGAGGSRADSILSTTVSQQVCAEGCIVTTTTLLANETRGLETGAQGTIRGRAGVIAGGALFYGTAGLALSEIDWTDTLTSNGATVSATSTGVRPGWVAGGGAETFVGPNLIFRTEYLFEDFKSFEVPLAGSSATGSLHPTAQKVRAGLSFKF
jgi:opacity protein-like surface antigen